MSNDGFEGICDLIAMGELDSELDGLVAAVGLRRKAINMIKESVNRKLAIGTRVRLVNIRPKYLNGQLGSIAKITGDKVSVKLDDRYTLMKAQRFVSPDCLITGPLSCIITVSS